MGWFLEMGKVALTAAMNGIASYVAVHYALKPASKHGSRFWKLVRAGLRRSARQIRKARR